MDTFYNKRQQLQVQYLLLVEMLSVSPSITKACLQSVHKQGEVRFIKQRISMTPKHEFKTYSLRTSLDLVSLGSSCKHRSQSIHLDRVAYVLGTTFCTSTHKMCEKPRYINLNISLTRKRRSRRKLKITLTYNNITHWLRRIS